MPTCRIDVTVHFGDAVDRSQVLEGIVDLLREQGAHISIAKIVDEQAITMIRRSDEEATDES